MIKPINVHPCANGALITATYHDGDIIVFERGGLALGYVNAAPVVHGHWIYKPDPVYDGGVFVCSECESQDDSEYDFCHGCGAKMDI